MLKFYFELSKEIANNSFKATYGSNFYDTLSKELIARLPNVKGLSVINLRYMEKFYLLYKDKITIVPQLVEELFSIPWGYHRYIIDKCKDDNPTFGILICRDKDKIVTEYSLENYNIPLGISSFKLNKLLPKELKQSFPSIEELESKLQN